jgi:hypothetical protein
MPTPRVASSRQDDLLPLGGAGSLGSRVDQTWTEMREGREGSAWHQSPRSGLGRMRGLRGMRDSGRMASLGPTSEKKREVPGTNCLAARRHRRATPNARSGSKPAGPSVDGQDVRRTMKGRAISIRPLDSQSPVRTSINRLYDGHLVRRELVGELSNPPPPASDTPRTFRLEAGRPQRRRTRCPSYKGERSVPGTNSVLAERSVPGTNSVLAERSVPGTNSVLLAL